MDDVALNWGAVVSALMKVGTNWHMLLEASQARKAVQDAVNPQPDAADSMSHSRLRSASRPQRQETS